MTRTDRLREEVRAAIDDATNRAMGDMRRIATAHGAAPPIDAITDAVMTVLSSIDDRPTLLDRSILIGALLLTPTADDESVGEQCARAVKKADEILAYERTALHDWLCERLTGDVVRNAVESSIDPEQACPCWHWSAEKLIDALTGEEG